MMMTQEERWMTRYKEVVSFIETNHRTIFRVRGQVPEPSKYN